MTEIDYGRLDALEAALGGRAAIEALYLARKQYESQTSPSVVSVDSGTAPQIDHTALIDQQLFYYDLASGKIKSKVVSGGGGGVSSLNGLTGAVLLGAAPQALSANGVSTAGLVPVALRAAHAPATAGLSDGTNTSGFTCLAYPILSPASEIVLSFSNAVLLGTPSPAYSDTFTVKASVEMADGTIISLTFAGAASATLTTGSVVRVLSDPVVTNGLSVGDIIYVHTLVTCASGKKWPAFMQPRYAGDSVQITTTDLSALLTTAREDILNVNGGFEYGPEAILAPKLLASRPTVAILGDSIAVGTGGTGAAGGAFEGGFLNIALGDKFPLLNLAVYGEALSTVAPTTYGGSPVAAFTYRAGLAPVADYAFQQYGSNDFNNGRTALQIETDEINFGKWVTSNGTRLYGTTISPRTTSSDSWATLGNQTVTANEAVRVAVNTWRRAGRPIDPSTHAPVAAGTGGALLQGQAGHPFLGNFDSAAAVESSLNSGKWKVTGAANAYTGDGAHPSQLAHQAMAATIDAKVLVGSSEIVIPRYTVSQLPVTPSTPSGLYFLLNPETMVPAVGALTSWPDDSGNGFGATAPHTAPVVRARSVDSSGNLLLNGFPSLRFSGGSTTDIELATSLSSPFEFFWVFRQNVLGATGYIITSGGPALISVNSTGGMSTRSGINLATPSDAFSNFHICSAIIGTGSDELRIDGQLVGTGSHAPEALNPVAIGGSYGSGAGALNGDFVFAAMYTTVMSTANRIGLTKWISNKFAIPLA